MVATSIASHAARGSEAETFSIGALAAEFGLTPRAIRLYEEEGLLAPGRRSGRRLFDRADRARLMLICRGKRLGFSLAEVREFLDLYELDPHQVDQMRYLLSRARARIANLEAQRCAVEQSLAELKGIERQIEDHLGAHTEGAAPAPKELQA